MRRVEKKSVHVIKRMQRGEKKKGGGGVKKKNVTKLYVAWGRGGVKRPSFHHDATTAVDHRDTAVLVVRVCSRKHSFRAPANRGPKLPL